MKFPPSTRFPFSVMSHYSELLVSFFSHRLAALLHSLSLSSGSREDWAGAAWVGEDKGREIGNRIGWMDPVLSDRWRGLSGAGEGGRSLQSHWHQRDHGFDADVLLVAVQLYLFIPMLTGILNREEHIVLLFLI